MPRATLGPQHDIALNALENAEYRSLAWGYVDGSFSEEEADDIVSTSLKSASIAVDPASVLDDLVDAALVRRWRSPTPRYRTRFGELVRLLIRSRQLFDGRPWQTSPTLVSDFRVDIRKRAIPRPSIGASEALGELAKLVSLSALQKKVWLSIAPKEPGLRRFQADCASRILSVEGEHGTIVTAGTGSGKTIAFYLPAMVSIAETLKSNDHWTRALCLYPRQELLKDQFTEAYRMCFQTSPSLAAAGRRGFTLGALYGGTPRRAEAKELAQVGWRNTSSGFVCPFVRCPQCGSDMQWRSTDLERRIERLACLKAGCGHETAPASVQLTRQSISQKPPDLLFTTTEMLNLRLSDTWSRHIFGIGQSRSKRPLFILLDEVHTYAGTSGAQAALLLRRWRHLLDSPVKWIGLSATLREAPQFFADLSGLRPDQVAEVTPQLRDMNFWGAEYQVLLRTDPSSQAATLSTSIQAAMLIARMLDPTADGPSDGRFGRRLFAFTDELDVTHRLFDDLRDAEAYDFFGRPNPNRSPLAFLRATSGNDAEEREAEGQRWDLAESLRGGSLQNRLVIGRTTSRDPGVDSPADVIVATAALEVGFNDPNVGAVLQHKAPRSFAAYLQRRGRAGRRPNMRPISVTVLSDYGRDRIAFQSYETLFDPVVERQILPTRNVYVLKIQAVYAFLDWISARVSDRGVRGWAWDILSRPMSAQLPSHQSFYDAAKALVQSVVRLDAPTLQDLSEHLAESLCLGEDELRSVLWEAPRSLLLEAVPTLARRLFCEWRLANGRGLDRAVPYHPLPEFIPRTLFEDLNLPEVTIEVPAATIRDVPKFEGMPVLQAINQFAPGRVRRRFADERGGLSHWIPVGLSSTEVELPIGQYATEREHLGYFYGSIQGKAQEIAVYRPTRMAISKTEKSILPTSHGAWNWQSQFEFIGEPFVVDLPARSPWTVVLPALRFFLHRFSSAASQLRFAADGHAEIRTRENKSHVHYSLVDESDESGIQKAAAVGIQAETDALCVDLRLPSSIDLASAKLPSSLQHWACFLRLRYAIANDELLSQDINYFQRDWLAQLLLFVVFHRAETDAISIVSVLQKLNDQSGLADFRRAAAALVGGAVLDEEDGDDARSRLEQTLIEIIDSPGVIPRLAELALESLSMSGEPWGEWLRSLLKNTLSEAALQAVLLAAPSNTALSGVTADLVDLNSTPTAVVAEVTLGGGGTIEALARVFSVEPRAFLRALDAALAPPDQEDTATKLEQVLRLVQSDQSVAAALQSLRVADSLDARDAARDALFKLLAQLQIPVSHALQVAIATRLLRPGSTAQTDALSLEMLEYWSALEARHGISIPVRVAASICASVPGLRTRLAALNSEPESEVGTASLLLWPRGGEVRLNALQSYNPFRKSALTDSALARAIFIDGRIPTVSIGEADWHARLLRELAARGQVRLTASSSDVPELRSTIVQLLAEPIEADYLRLHAVVEGRFQLPDGSQAVELAVRERS